MDNQNCIFFMNTSGEMDTLQCLSEEELTSLLQNRESLEERSHFYKIQPEENQGKLIFLSGTPGSGKSSVALRLAQKEGFVYYEGDCFGNFINPYIPLHVSEPSMAAVKQKPVKGMSRDAVDAAFNVDLVFAEMAEGNLSNQELAFPFLKILGQDIASEKKKIGGDWVVAMALPTRQMREIIQNECSAIFVVLNMDENTQRKRIESRHSHGDESTEQTNIDYLTGIHSLYETCGADEKDAIDCWVEADMSVDDVSQKVLELVKKVEEAKMKEMESMPSKMSKKASSTKSTKVCNVL